MTAEIGIMNRMAVALAADSAVTISGKKIYNSANKLFALSKYYPIGIMVYGNAEFMGVPWETIIKIYRTKLNRKCFPHLEDYANHFIEFIEKADFLQAAEDDYFNDITYSYLSYIRGRIEEKVQDYLENNPNISETTTKKIIRATIEYEYKELEGLDFLPNFDKSFVDELRVERYSQFINAIETIFEKLPLTKHQVNKLVDICTFIFTKGKFRDDISGIVIAGFGEKEIFPSILSYEMAGILRQRLKYIKNNDKSNTIKYDMQAAIIPFAQSEMVHTFVRGIDPYLNNFSNSFLKRVFTEYPRMIADRIDIPDEKKKAKLSKQLEEVSRKIFEKYREGMIEYSKENHINPILRVVAVLPKEELATMAETLVNITSFKRRITMAIESVGGPIDVAIISKGDGFVWIKRKHYFKPELNKLFLDNYFRGDDENET